MKNQVTADPKEYDVTKRRPQVLLFGNGMVRAAGGPSWAELITGLVAKDKHLDEKWIQNLPTPILADALFSPNDTSRQNDYFNALVKQDNICSDAMIELLQIPFDAILTTNYTHELENIFRQYMHKRSTKSRTCRAPEQRFVVRLYNQVEKGPQIWHIHGDIDKKSSIILSHDEYQRANAKIVEYNKQRRNDYCTYAHNLKFKSWFDYFMMGDVYIIGCGFDYAESDLWWLLNRRKREKAQEVGKIVYYDPNDKLDHPNKVDERRLKHEVMTELGIECKDLGVFVRGGTDTEKNEDYHTFYHAAVQDIRARVAARCTGEIAE